jgi:cell division septation protein DedD
MDSTLKQRLIGAAVLAALAVIFLPMLLKGPDVREPDAAEVPLSMPATPGQDFETRELPLTQPDGATPPGGVLGMAGKPGDATGTAGPAPAPAPDTAAAAPPLAESPPAPAPDTAAAAPPPTVSPTPPAPLPAPPVAAGSYSVSIGTFSNLDSADALTAKLRAAKLPVTSEKLVLASGSAVRIRVGPYADHASAEAARLRAEAITGGSAKVVVLDASASPAVAPKLATTSPAKTPIAPVAPATATTPDTAAIKTPAPATPAASKPAVISAGFAVQLSAPSVEADANALRERARTAGFNSFVQRIETDSGVRFRVRLGPVADRAAAQTLLDAANSKLGIKGIVVSNP